MLRDLAVAAGIGQFAGIQTVASMDIELRAFGLREAGEIEQAIAAFARESFVSCGCFAEEGLWPVNGRRQAERYAVFVAARSVVACSEGRSSRAPPIL